VKRPDLRALAIAPILGILLHPAPLSAQAHAGAHWSYAGETGPTHWSELDTAFAKCGIGGNQSPIDLSVTTPPGLLPLRFQYRSISGSILNNGHTVQVNVDSGAAILVDSTRYELLQFHFHVPSEHSINGRPADAELHLVHRNRNGGLAVVGVLLVKGKESAALAPLMQALPAHEGPPVRLEHQVDLGKLLPNTRTTYGYSGSLTTPPCTEGVKWIVMATPLSLSDQQLSALAAILHGNNRPLQPLHGRVMSLSTTP